ncbi:unnamed protein product [Vitrella brassicaformis CCMP3155]|uniref:Cyclin-like domain-containing protein n=1 Tax=Vitrella brassicaformis (strain CCMP3155) TaxID=1169540 RepID=A0A0G4FL39_VITBC|nr:unnamed protein product [Vitrella brassicaformis CCMP3155]|eukprot:CEM14618.1 unnamed protein product [Vitrella brassicaformis CCMP3155]
MSRVVDLPSSDHKVLSLIPAEYVAQRSGGFGLRRASVVDEIIYAATMGQLADETLYLSVRLLDYMLCKLWCDGMDILPEYYTITGLACLLVASQIEDTYPDQLEVSDIVSISNCQAEDICRMQNGVLMSLWSDGVSTDVWRPPTVFLHQLCGSLPDMPLGSRYHAFAKYLCELVLFDVSVLHLPSNIIAAAAVYMTRKIWLHDKDSWPAPLSDVSGVSKGELRRCGRVMADILRSIKRSECRTCFDAVVRKWEDADHHKWGTVVFE